jgi:UDP-glucose 4-epimerase
MRVFVTGAAGFLGSWLVNLLLESGHEVGALVRSPNGTWRLDEIADRIKLVTGSFDDFTALEADLRLFRPQVVVHLGWRGVGNQDRNSSQQAQNIVDATRLVALCGTIEVKAFVGAGSQAEYGVYQRAIKVDDVPRPTTLYGMAKLAAGTMSAQIAADAGLRMVWLRVFSTYGPKDADYWLIPSIIKSLRAGKRMSLTSCEQQWGFLHARDAAAAFLLAVEDSRAQGVFNLGSPDAPPLRKTVMALRDLVNPAAELGFGDLPYRPDQVMILQADVSQLAKLDWKPQIALSDGLRETAEWYAKHS